MVAVLAATAALTVVATPTTVAMVVPAATAAQARMTALRTGAGRQPDSPGSGRRQRPPSPCQNDRLAFLVSSDMCLITVNSMPERSQAAPDMIQEAAA